MQESRVQMLQGSVPQHYPSGATLSTAALSQADPVSPEYMSYTSSHLQKDLYVGIAQNFPKMLWLQISI